MCPRTRGRPCRNQSGSFKLSRPTHLLYYGIHLFLWPEREAVEDRLSERTTGWLQPWLGPVHPGGVPPVMPAVCIFSISNDDAGMQEGASNGPQEGRDLARRQQVVNVDGDLGALHGQGVAVRPRRLAGRLGARRRVHVVQVQRGILMRV